MATKVSKSRVFAVIVQDGLYQDVNFFWKRTADGVSTLEHQREVLQGWGGGNRDQLIALLTKAGLTVRFFDPEEKQWMDNSLVYGLVRAPGSRDGQWGPPDLEQFEEEYLTTV